MANRPGTYSSPLDRPAAPSASARSTSPRATASSTGCSGRSAVPANRYRIVPCEASTATFCASRPATIPAKSPSPYRPAGGAGPLTGVKYRPMYEAASGAAQIQENPSCPTTSVVTPCASAPVTTPSATSDPSACTCASIKPGHTTLPATRSSTAASTRAPTSGPTATIVPSSTSTSAGRSCAATPSATSPRQRTSHSERRAPTRSAALVETAGSALGPAAAVGLGDRAERGQVRLHRS